MATEQELRLHRCCFTGHRPQKLNRPEAEIKKSLEDVKSKHRSQFIKREGLKELAQLDMAAALRDISVDRHC